MVRHVGLALIWGCCWLAGCHSANSTRSAPLASSSLEKSANAVELYLAYVEQPFGDPFLNNDVPQADGAPAQKALWSSADQKVVNFDRQILLEENGFRVGQIVGVVPSRLMTLLKSVNPTYQLLPCGQPTTLRLPGPVLPRGTFQVKIAGQSQQITLEQPQFCLDVVASLTSDGRSKLEFTPKVEHRQTAFPFELSPDLSGDVRQTAKPHRSFPQVGWQVVLKPGETLVIGAHMDKPGSLGFRSFTQEEGGPRLQRVLVLRTSRPIEDP